MEGVSDLAREQIMEMLQRPRRPEPVSDVFTILHTAMEGGRGDAVMFVWGMAEAISFPDHGGDEPGVAGADPP